MTLTTMNKCKDICSLVRDALNGRANKIMSADLYNEYKELIKYITDKPDDNFDVSIYAKVHDDISYVIALGDFGKIYTKDIVVYGANVKLIIADIANETDDVALAVKILDDTFITSERLTISSVLDTPIITRYIAARVFGYQSIDIIDIPICSEKAKMYTAAANRLLEIIQGMPDTIDIYRARDYAKSHDKKDDK